MPLLYKGRIGVENLAALRGPTYLESFSSSGFFSLNALAFVMSAAVTVIWVTMGLLGQWSLLLLLGTLFFVKSLPQRNNPSLVNFIFTTFLSTFPDCLLFFFGHQDDVPPRWLCITQSVLMDGIAPMFAAALLILAVHTWAEVMALVRDMKFMARALRATPVKWSLILIPYIVLASFCTASLVAAFYPSAKIEHTYFVYCSNQVSDGTIAVRKKDGPFVIACGIVEVLIQVFTALLLFAGRSTPVKYTESYRTNMHMFLRLLAFSSLQLAPIIIVEMNQHAAVNSREVGDVTEILESLCAFLIFLIFGTQRAVLQTWKSWIWRTNQKPEDGHCDPNGMV